jgi:serine protease Do
MKLKQILFTVLISGLTTLGVIWGYAKITKKNNTYAGQEKGATPSNYHRAGLFDGDGAPAGNLDFTSASTAAIPTVVHIKAKTNAKQLSNSLPRQQQQRQRSPFDDFFGDDIFQQFFGNRNMAIPEQQASGSGVIVSEDGYIVTNNHVIDNADEIKITLSNKKTYTAKLIGADPAYDLAVIKIEAAALPFLVYGNSDDLKVGQWVLALGYPLDLEATVTAGIVSAKARSIGLNKDRFGQKGSGVESFIQTDAAVNKGNSGGALINTDGKLVGINSAIFSPTGFYSGYSYAIPVNIVKKVVDDLIKYGNVQRGFMGVSTKHSNEVTEAERSMLNFKGEGLVVTGIDKEGGAYQAGMRNGDIIRKVNNIDISSTSELQEAVGKLKPGDKVNVVYSRNGNDNAITITLKNKMNNLEIIKEDNSSIMALGGDFVTLDPKKAREFEIPGGVVVKRVKEQGALDRQTRMKDGFVILKINDTEVKSVDDMRKAIGRNSDFTISGFYPGYDGIYEYPISLSE